MSRGAHLNHCRHFCRRRRCRRRTQGTPYPCDEYIYHTPRNPKHTHEYTKVKVLHTQGKHQELSSFALFSCYPIRKPCWCSPSRVCCHTFTTDWLPAPLRTRHLANLNKSQSSLNAWMAVQPRRRSAPLFLTWVKKAREGPRNLDTEKNTEGNTKLMVTGGIVISSHKLSLSNVVKGLVLLVTS